MTGGEGGENSTGTTQIGPTHDITREDRTANENQAARVADHRKFVDSLNQLEEKLGTLVAIRFSGPDQPDRKNIEAHVLRNPVTIAQSGSESDVRYIVVTGGDNPTVSSIQFLPNKDKPDEGYSKDMERRNEFRAVMEEAIKRGGQSPFPDPDNPELAKRPNGVYEVETYGVAHRYFACTVKTRDERERDAAFELGAEPPSVDNIALAFNTSLDAAGAGRAGNAEQAQQVKALGASTLGALNAVATPNPGS